MKRIAVILAGGTGGRLWPESTGVHPKQFRSFVSDLPMVLDTYNLVCKYFNPADVYVITFKKYKKLLKSAIETLPTENILLEPFGRNTAPAIALAQAMINHKYDDDDIITVFPSDHIIGNQDEYINAVATSIETAESVEAIVSIGIEPDFPNSQLGYIQYADNGIVENLYEKGVRKAKVFAEKPDIDTAKRFIESGDFVWNTGIFSTKMKLLKSELNEHLPMLSGLIKKIEAKIGAEDFNENRSYVYKQINSVSIDHGLLEKTERLYIVKSNFGWSDLATWDEYFNHCEKDKHNNVIKGNVLALKTSNSLIKSTSKLIAVTDVDNLIVVESEDAIFISGRGMSSNVKDLVHYLRAKELNKMIK
ncbi:MAG: mannose-1-phosphate guanylyltransferase [Ignavibacteriae bacterium]|nr:mannose-1-phosphate guanylyltransferase [Ignavibacteriota bacterium]